MNENLNLPYDCRRDFAYLCLVLGEFINKSQSSSNNTRTPRNSTCTATPSIPTNSSDKISRDGSTLPQGSDLPSAPHFLRAIAGSDSSAQHTLARATRQVAKNLPGPNGA